MCVSCHGLVPILLRSYVLRIGPGDRGTVPTTIERRPSDSVTCMSMLKISRFLRPWLALVRVDSCVRLHDCRVLFRLPPPTALPTGCRWYSYLTAQFTGVKAWQAAQEKEKEENINFEELCNSMIHKLETYRRARCRNVTKIFDRCTTKEQLSLAEKVLASFRCSFLLPGPGLPLVVVRACIRVGSPEKALHFVREKVLYGIFPSRRVYHILIDALLTANDGEGAVSAYEQMQLDEVDPDHNTFFLAAIAYASVGTPESLDKALELSEECGSQAPELRERVKKRVVNALVKQNQVEKALEVLDQFQEKQGMKNQMLFNCRFAALLAGNLPQAVSLLDELGGGEPPPHLVGVTLPEWAQESLQQSVASSGDESLQASLEAVIEKLKSSGRLRLQQQETPSDSSCQQTDKNSLSMCS